MLTLVLWIFGAGVLGGIVNALLSDNGFVLPKAMDVDQVRIIRPGFIGNAVVGGVAAVVSWGLYGPFASGIVVGAPPASGVAVGLTLASLVGAVLVGVGGARWLTNEVDKRLLKTAATQAALRAPSTAAASQIAAGTPAAALRIAASM